MKTKWLTNPFFVYIISFLLVFLVYSLGWSKQYPPVSLTIKLFLFATFIISFFLAFILEKTRMNVFQAIPVSKYLKVGVGALYFGYFLEFAYSGGVPLLLAIRGGYSYKDFTGIPTFHVLLATFNIFYSTYIFHQYTSTTGPRRGLLWMYILSVLPMLLVLNRGSIVLTLGSSFFVYLMKLKRLKITTLIAIPTGFLLLIFLFGVIGNMRYSVSQEDKTYILRIGGASEEFINNNVPAEYYWGYLYIATPIGNFQNIVSAKDDVPVKYDNIPFFALTEPFPEFISKRLVSIFKLDDPGDSSPNYLVIEALNAPSVYFQSYSLLGWLGAWLIFGHSVLIMLFYPFLVGRKSKYYVTAWTMMVTIVLMNIFSNMWHAAGTNLIWPLIFAIFEKYKLKKNEQSKT
ncbi:O-antigen polymerase [Chitinophaga arvensicola]|uniref:Oligosaccharide repeat unit polymerase n=1 Tax=Chitinophaga arvensicola TaxID=29529 RepID=A0A1I0NNW0_9BACT|nr:O-antigen polymerase [Chitinophaga arvensicola]SEW03246.1 hypothetical protein SAMN04488122_0294 [Chitinophaga arvensicola]